MQQCLADSEQLTVKFDWIEVTIKDLSPKKIIENILNLSPGDFNALKAGRFGYNHQIRWNRGNVSLLYNVSNGHYAEDEMGVHLLITGSGCDALASELPLRDLISLVVGGSKYKFTRIDLAIDDRQERLLRMNRVQHYANRGLFTSRWNNRLEINKLRNSDNQGIGKTIYFGSKRSTLYCRFYDKSLEQRQKYHNDRKRLKRVPKHWTRLEVVFKKERANLLIEHLVKNYRVGLVIRQVLNNYLRFLRLGTDQHKHRRETADWWNQFIGSVSKLKLTTKPDNPSIEKMTSWLDRQITPTIATVMKAHDGELNWLFKMITEAKSRMKRKHLDAIAQYRAKKLKG